MKITIVTISYNQANYLEKAICSVIEQGYPNLEYIVIDPGSTDKSREIIERYRSRISKIIFDPDTGPADGLNKGFSAATGDVFGFLNSDDVLQEGALASVARYFQAMPSVDVISGHSGVINSSGFMMRTFYSDSFSLWMAARGASILSQASTFFRANIYHEVGGFNVENRIAWDGELFADMAILGAKFARVNEVWSNFRIHEDGITGSGKLHQLYEEYSDYIFRKIIGRDPIWIDRVTILFARLVRKFTNPLDTWERLLHGPIYRSCES